MTRDTGLWWAGAVSLFQKHLDHVYVLRIHKHVLRNPGDEIATEMMFCVAFRMRFHETSNIVALEGAVDSKLTWKTWGGKWNMDNSLCHLGSEHHQQTHGSDGCQWEDVDIRWMETFRRQWSLQRQERLTRWFIKGFWGWLCHTVWGCTNDVYYLDTQASTKHECSLKLSELVRRCILI